MKFPAGRRRIATLQSEIRRFGSMSSLVFCGSLCGAAFPMAYLSLSGMVLLASEFLGVHPEHQLGRLPDWVLLSTTLCWEATTVGVAFVIAGIYRRTRTTKARRTLRGLDEDDQRSVLLPLLEDRDAAGMARRLMAELRLPILTPPTELLPALAPPTELLPSSAPQARGDEVRPLD